MWSMRKRQRGTGGDFAYFEHDLTCAKLLLLLYHEHYYTVAGLAARETTAVTAGASDDATAIKAQLDVPSRDGV